MALGDNLPAADKTVGNPGHTDDHNAIVGEIAATQAVVDSHTSQMTGFAPSSHNHNASAITLGTVATARLGSGTANATTFLSGDQTYKYANPNVTPKITAQPGAPSGAVAGDVWIDTSVTL